MVWRRSFAHSAKEMLEESVNCETNTDRDVLTPRFADGAIAQLGERLNGIQEVRGSTPLGSTNPSLNCLELVFGCLGRLGRNLAWEGNGKPPVISYNS